LGFRDILDGIAGAQARHPKKIIVLGVLLTLFFAAGVARISLETDFSEELPPDNPAVDLNQEIQAKFGGQDLLFVSVKLDYESTSDDAVQDIRDPKVMQMLLNLQEELAAESSVERTQSIADTFKDRPMPESTDGVKKMLEFVPGSRQYFNRDYSSTLLYVYSGVGASNEKIKALIDTVEKDVQETPVPPGLELDVTGMPAVQSTLMDVLVEDARYTIALAAFIILILLLIINRPATRGLFVFTPLVIGLIWTLGTMGWLNIPLSVVTVGVGAMILGLGVEYSVFYVSTYEDERDGGKERIDALKTTIREVGTAIMGSSTTTMVGFLALLTATMPMLHHLGFALALGIFYCVVAALLVNPAFIVAEEEILGKIYEKIHERAFREVKK